MQKKLKIKSIFFDGIEFPVECLNNSEDGIKFYLTTDIGKYFFVDVLFGKTYSFDKVLIKNSKNKLLTLFECFYTTRSLNDKLYIHMTFNEIVYGQVNERNFMVDSLNVDLEFYNDTCINNISFDIDDIHINFSKIDNKNYIILINSDKKINNSEMYSYFCDFFEMLFFMFGYFPIRKKVMYINDGIKIIVENNIVDKYITDKRYRYKDFYFLNYISSEDIRNIYINYRNFSQKNILQLSMFFIAIMESNSYAEINMVQILQVLDGIFSTLKEFSYFVYEFSEEYKKQILNMINDMDFSTFTELKECDIKNKLNGLLSRCNEISFRKKLKLLFNINSGIIFQSEIKNIKGHLSFNSLVNKCYGSRNRISHSSSLSVCLEGLENVVYMYKMVLLIRILIFNEVGITQYINDSLFQRHIENIDSYIEKIFLNL